MAGLIALSVCLGLLALALLVHQLILHRRMRRLQQQMERFLSRGGKALDYSVYEDSLSPLTNAAAELEDRLLRARENEAAECRRTSALTADISHQLKTPLAALRLFCELDEGAHLRQQIEQIERMERLIYALLRLERLCADGYAFSFTPCDVGDLVREGWQSLQDSYPDRTLTIRGTALVRCDPKWLGEAFLNLLKNACEHTQPGGLIIVTLEMTDASFFCTLEDDGGGVPRQELPHLFTRFYRVSGQAVQGVGLGLAIVREIILRHHGDIRAENGEKGLRMRITLPLIDLSSRDAARS